MFQRLQSLYIVVALIGQGALYYFPGLGFSGPNMQTIKVTALQVVSSTATAQNQEAGTPIPLVLISGVALGLIITSLMGHRNRKKQMLLALAASFACLAYMVSTVVYLFKWHEVDGFVFTPSLSPAFLIPVANFLFMLLAYKGIKKDDDLIKSIDRIR